jgi:allantoinase
LEAGGLCDILNIDLVIKNCRIATSDGILDASLAIDEGKIISISKDRLLPKADITIDAHENIVLPGLIDPHVHFRDPGNTGKEDFESGTKAAAAGGFSSIFDMPNTHPPIISSASFEEKKSIAGSKAVVDFGLYAGSGLESMDSIPIMAKAGAIAFKIWTFNPSRSSESRGLYGTDIDFFRKMLTAVLKVDGLQCVHAESQEVIDFETNKLIEEGRKDVLAHVESRPNKAEYSAVSLMIQLAREVGTRLHFVHLSTGEALSILREARSHGFPVSAETCPHYLVLTGEHMRKLGPYAKINPPLRSTADNNALWQGLRENSISTIGSDHAPHSKDEKELGWNDIWRAPSGASNIECTLPIMLTKVNEGLISLQQLVKVMSENTARIYRLYPKKGSIQEGSDADLTIIDLKKKYRIRTDRMYSKDKWSALYDGWGVQGQPVMTIVRGEIVMKDGEVLGRAGYGKMIRPRVNERFGKSKM